MYVGGEIADLAAIGRPSIGVVTAVQAVHLSRIGTLDAIERAKGELLEALPADGTAVLNADDPIVTRMDGRTVARALRYGFAADADVRAGSVASLGLDGMRFRLRTPAGETRRDDPDARSAVRPQRARRGRGRPGRRPRPRRHRSRPARRLVGTASRRGRPAPRRRPSSTTRTTRRRVRSAPRSTSSPTVPGRHGRRPRGDAGARRRARGGASGGRRGRGRGRRSAGRRRHGRRGDRRRCRRSRAPAGRHPARAGHRDRDRRRAAAAARWRRRPRQGLARDRSRSARRRAPPRDRRGRRRPRSGADADGDRRR